MGEFEAFIELLHKARFNCVYPENAKTGMLLENERLIWETAKKTHKKFYIPDDIHIMNMNGNINEGYNPVIYKLYDMIYFILECLTQSGMVEEKLFHYNIFVLNEN